MQFSQRYKFSDWPNPTIPALAAGVYAIWDNEILIYCDMSRREFEKAQLEQKKKYGLIRRLASHASGAATGSEYQGTELPLKFRLPQVT
jgi:hypothetical protein